MSNANHRLYSAPKEGKKMRKSGNFIKIKTAILIGGLETTAKGE